MPMPSAMVRPWFCNENGSGGPWSGPPEPAKPMSRLGRA
jgi:hypothetical protein